MRKIFIITCIFVITIFGANYLVDNYLDTTLSDIEDSGNNEKTLSGLTNTPSENEKIKDTKEIENKISLLRGRFAIRGLIQKGDTYLENRELNLALKSYLGAIKQNPNDNLLIKKIGDTYFEMNKYTIAYKYYKNIIGTKTLDPQKITIAYINSLTLEDNTNLNLTPIHKEISSFGLSPADTFFYNTSLECLIDIKGCQKKFETFISQGKAKDNKNISLIKKAFSNYKALQVKQEYFKDTHFVSALFQAKLYPISNILGEDILNKKTGYLPILKIISKGHFELGNNKQAKKYLLEYNAIDKKDTQVNYLLGIVNINLSEYVLSNVYFTKAKKLGFSPKSTISRRLIYNYYLVEDSIKMMQEFKYLIEETKDLSPLDYSLGIYYSLINGEEIQANKWTNKALELYPEVDDFYGYKGWIYKEGGDLSSAEKSLKKGFELNSHNPLINLNLGILESEKENFLKAKIYLKNTIKEDPNGDFGKAASEELINVEQKQKEFNQKIEDSLEEI